MGIACAAKVHSIRVDQAVEGDRRRSGRKSCTVEVTSRPLGIGEGMTWGGTVNEISANGLKLGLCFPFSPGTYLAVDLQLPRDKPSRSLVCRVVHVHDHADGTWTLGCEFVKPLEQADVEVLA